MSRILPKRPTGNSSEAKYHQRLWDVINSLVSQVAPKMLTSVTTRGVFQMPTAKGGMAEPAEVVSGMRWRGVWTEVDSYEVGDVVRMPLLSGGSGGQELGTFICIADVGPGGPQPVNTSVYPYDTSSLAYWQIISAESWDSIGVGGTGSITMSAGTNPALLSLETGRFDMQATVGGSTRRLTIVLHGVDAVHLPDEVNISLRELTYEWGGSVFRTFALMSEPEFLGPA